MSIKINIEVSARHIHLSQKDVERLFGRGYELKPLKKLSQPGQYAGKETVKIKTKKGEFDAVRVLGPTREETQVEISMTDSYELGIKAPIRMSGDLQGTPGIKIIGPKGSLNLKKGVIVAKRHIHATLDNVKKYKLKNNQKVSVLIPSTRFARSGSPLRSESRQLRFDEVVVRVDENYFWACHVDTDEGNAAGISGIARGEAIR